MTVELKSRLWVDHRSEKWANNRPIKIEAIPLTSHKLAVLTTASQGFNMSGLLHSETMYYC